MLFRRAMRELSAVRHKAGEQNMQLTADRYMYGLSRVDPYLAHLGIQMKLEQLAMSFLLLDKNVADEFSDAELLFTLGGWHLAWTWTRTSNKDLLPRRWFFLPAVLWCHLDVGSL